MRKYFFNATCMVTGSNLQLLHSMLLLSKGLKLFNLYLSNVPDPLEDQFKKRTDAKKERIAKNELQRLRNIARTKNKKGEFYGYTISIYLFA